MNEIASNFVHSRNRNTISCNILGNRPAPYARDPPFQKHDPRLQYSLQPFDPRVHFALVCGAKSCPAIRVYNAQNVNEALEWAAEAFISEEVIVDLELKKVKNIR